MTERVKGRHRATSPATTPLSILGTGINQVVGDRMDAIGRGGAVLVVTSGLVASVGVPALAAPEGGSKLLSDTNTLTLGLGALANSLADAPKTVGADAPAIPLTAQQNSSVVTEKAQPGVDVATSNPVAAGRAAKAEGVLSAIAAGEASAAQSGGTAAKTAAKPAAAKTTTAAKVAAKPATVAKTTTKAATKAATKATTKTTAVKGASARGSAVLSVAARYVGIYYRSGGTTPAGFDCSGYTKHVFKQVGLSLPRTAQQQLRATTRISRSAAKPGDLVFMVGSSGTAYHVGIYAGGNMMYDSPRTGKAISKRKIWTNSVVFGRL